ncbi:aminopeptidase P family protein [Sneathiella marina]|uniref:Aminopeptidase P family protein n=1 Tax=Sneathiella marina TaxID=2950108 RepID=A0ABY4VZT0_9PROT|nr:aminopeptidase P family protein [Sneathiella marina]USG60390.1 aminopeptidase P family protein [Sneathiella marina]
MNTAAEIDALLATTDTDLSKESLTELIEAVASAPYRPDEDNTLRHVLPGLSSEEMDSVKTVRDAIREKIGQNVLSPESSSDRLAALRAKMLAENSDGFIVPLNDEYHGEAAPACSERLKWLTGFTGSAGVAAVLKEKAAIFVDGRYTLQVVNEVDTSLFEPRHVSDEPMFAWIEDNMVKGQTLAIDPWLHTESSVNAFKQLTKRLGILLKEIDTNFIDDVWTDRPQPPLAMVVPHADIFSGETSRDKRAAVAATLQENGVDACIHTLPDVNAWLLNIRGADLPCTPFALGFGILHKDATVDLYMDERKLSSELPEHLGNSVRLFNPDQFQDGLANLVGKAVQVDPASTSQWIVNKLKSAQAKIVRADDPCLLPKATKNATEVAGTRNAHIRDGAAVTKFLHWLSLNAASGSVDEISAEEKLREFRKTGDKFKDLSFPTISAAGPNGALCHYRSTTASNRKLETGTLYLVDSGGQYLDGTTDITRTIAVGEPSEEMRQRFTLVLKGHIALATARFPKGTTGSQLDTLARAPLWAAGLDYDHGTGHGVGSYLSVHEGPQRISKMPNSVALQPGMIISNEPGFYKADDYGIRIENLVTVFEIEGLKNAELTTYGFETLTFAPLDQNLIEGTLLTTEEVQWVNDYHQAVWNKISPLVSGDVKDWLQSATASI